ncbi:hypothetical protein CTAYLR_001998 [Chrysophaeum taylorii]|uniref:Protein kinase domain-containing protein n=1 Tax=Chrysophaeum taylorii TaxID=2483200 RepID=A0AAD7U9B4_9STRA|nr:hypothetical protein CTAYLR_001998 [Chrysophaeum taylorii]
MRGGRDEASCALFYLCVDAPVPLCCLFLALCGVSFVGSIAVVSYLLATRSLGSAVSDPITSVGVTDAVLAASLASGGVVALAQSLKTRARDVHFGVAYAAFFATCVFATVSTRLVHASVGGGGRLRRKETASPPEESKTTRIAALGSLEDVADLEARPTEDERWPGLAVALRTDTLRLRVRLTIAATYVLAALVSFAWHFAESALVVVALGACAATIASLVMCRQVALRAGASYPRAEARRVRRAISLVALAHAVRTLFVVLACIFLYSLSRRRPFCGGKRRTKGAWPLVRSTMECSLAVLGALDAVAFFSNSPWADFEEDRQRRRRERDRAAADDDGEIIIDADSPASARRQSSLELATHLPAGGGVPPGAYAPWAQSIAPLHLIRVDDAALLDAPVVGRGTFGTVRRLGAGHVSCGRQLLDAGVREVAVKSFSPYDTGDEDVEAITWVRHQLELLRTEAYRVAKLVHRRIVLSYGIAESPRLGPCLVTEYLDGGSLFDILGDERRASIFPMYRPALARRVARHVADALRYMHAVRVTHRDLKSANVLVDTERRTLHPLNFKFKVADLGTSRVLLEKPPSLAPPPRPTRVSSSSNRRSRRARRPTYRSAAILAAAKFFDFRRGFFFDRWRPGASDGKNDNSQSDGDDDDDASPAAAAASRRRGDKFLTTQVGTPLFMAPELLVRGGTVSYDRKIDVYSYAILLWEISAHRTNWYGEDPGPGCDNLFQKVLEDGRPNTDDPNFDPHLVALMRRCWHRDPLARPTFDEIHEILVQLRRRQDSKTTPPPPPPPNKKKIREGRHQESGGSQGTDDATPASRVASSMSEEEDAPRGRRYRSLPGGLTAAAAAAPPPPPPVFSPVVLDVVEHQSVVEEERKSRDDIFLP